MRRFSLIFMFFYFLSTSFLCFPQDVSISDWQEQILSNINEEEISDASYARLAEMLSDLELRRWDTIASRRVRQDLILRGDLCLNIREGYHDATPEKISSGKAYLGNPWNQTLRYKLQIGDIWSAGLLLAKDAGEGYRSRFPMSDSYSGYISYRAPTSKYDRSIFYIQRIILGNYRINLGSGLILNQQFSFGKNLQNETFMDNGTSVSPHSSADEYNYFQGGVAEIRAGRFKILPFISFKQIDAAVSNDTITSIPTDGLHRTVTGANKRHNATVFSTGLHTSYSGEWFELGTNILFTRFSLPYYRPLRAYNIYYYRGQQLSQASIDYHIRRVGFVFKGETAIDHNLNLATIGQLRHSIGEDWNCSLLYRYYSQKYQQLYASSVSENSSIQGENGLALTINGSPLPHWQVHLICDYFDCSNVQYGLNAPVRGFDTKAQISYAHRDWDINLSYRLKSKASFRHNLDLVLSYKLIEGLLLKTQIRGKLYSPRDKGGYSTGYAAAQSISWNKDSSPIKCDLQAAWFNTPNYDTRIYISEKNILYGFGIPMLYGKGARCSLTGSYKIRPNITLDLKYAFLHYTDRDYISSGLQKIWGCNQYNLWLQLRLKL